MKETDIRTIKRLADIKAALTARALTSNELAEAIYIDKTQANKYIRDLLGDRIHIESWRRVSWHIIACYRWGNGKDAPKLPAMTKRENEQSRIARIKKDPEAHDRYLSHERARTTRRKATKQPNTWASALFVGVRAGSMSGEG